MSDHLMYAPYRQPRFFPAFLALKVTGRGDEIHLFHETLSLMVHGHQDLG
jgi:hypothetical protein